MSNNLESLNDPISQRPNLPDFGCYLRWPEMGESWIHPEDIDRTKLLLPSRRVFKRTRWDGEFYWLQYGEHCIRVRPTLWVRVQDTDLDVGQQVEVLARFGENDAGIFRIVDILLHTDSGEVEFYLQQSELPLKRRFSRLDIRAVEISYNLRSDFFEPEPQKSHIPDDVELLDVGDLLDDSKENESQSRSK